VDRTIHFFLANIQSIYIRRKLSYSTNGTFPTKNITRVYFRPIVFSRLILVNQTFENQIQMTLNQFEIDYQIRVAIENQIQMAYNQFEIENQIRIAIVFHFLTRMILLYSNEFE
jgi:hypothetical protein